MSPEEIHGRFLPSRTYDRWKWTVRFGLLIVPFLVILTGGLILFLTPKQYRCKTLISVENGPAGAEIAELIESRSVLERTIDHLELSKRMEVDRETAAKLLLNSIQSKFQPDTRLIEITVTSGQKNQALDIARQIPASLRDFLVETTKNQHQQKAGEIDKLIRDATDSADEKAAVLANLEKIHGENTADPASASTLERVRRASLLADAETERLKHLHSQCLTENLDSLPHLIVHSKPVLNPNPFSPKIGTELNKLAAKSLISGLLAALLLPYLMELAFSPRKIQPLNPDPVDNL